MGDDVHQVLYTPWYEEWYPQSRAYYIGSNKLQSLFSGVIAQIISDTVIQGHGHMRVPIYPGDILHIRWSALLTEISFPVVDHFARCAPALWYVPCPLLWPWITDVRVSWSTMRAETFMAAVSNGKKHDSFAVFVVYLFRGADRDIITETGEDAYRFLVFGHCCSYLLCYSIFQQI